MSNNLILRCIHEFETDLSLFDINEAIQFGGKKEVMTE